MGCGKTTGPESVGFPLADTKGSGKNFPEPV
jgi:hypothetical protein